MTGSNFTAAENVTINYDANPAMPAFTLGSTATTFTRTFTIPASVSGNHTITAIGASSGTATAILTVTPKITSNRTTGIAGNSVTVSGTGFAASENGVAVNLGETRVSSTISVNAVGSWTSSFDIPVMPGGSYALQALGNVTLAATVPSLSLQVTPYFTISPDNAPEGQTISVSGFGFKANESNIIVSWNTIDVSKPVQADANGSWSSSFVVPASSGGSHDIFARGQATLKTAVPKVSFGVGASISINKTGAKTGDSITVSGAGFAKNESGITILFDKLEIPVSEPANESGSWSARFTIPLSSGGLHKIDARGRTTPASAIADLNFTVLPNVTTNTSAGTAGTTVTFKGNGFIDGETITILYDGKPLGAKITADSSGAWQAAVTIPPSPGGQRTLQVNGTVTAATLIGSLSFEVAPALSITPTAGFVGSRVSITGSGFTAGSKLAFWFDNTDLSISSARTDDSGSFSQTITIPKAPSGDHTIRVVDSQNRSFEAVFTLDSTAPLMPKLASPPDGVTMGFFGNITPALEWSKVSDPSGVSYNLQIDSDPDFNNPKIDISGLTVNKYTVKKAEALARGQYYWRVQSVDGASNVSLWTDASTIISGKISPVIFSLMLLAAVIVIGAGIFVPLRLVRHRNKVRRNQAAEIVIPEVVNAEYRQIEGDKKALPWRLALPQAPHAGRGSKNVSGEDQARLRVIIDFARSMPLAEPGNNTGWLVELAENASGVSASPTLYSQIVKGELQLRYEPAWVRHPTYLDLLTLLEGQPILQDLASFIESVNRTAVEAEAALGDIYQEIKRDISWDIFINGGWVYLSSVYIDSFNWFQGKYLKEPSEKDYSIKAEPLTSGGSGFGLYAESNTPFAGLLIRTTEEKDAAQLRTLHSRLRRIFRNNEHIKTVVGAIMQLEIQRQRLLNAFSQFGRLHT